MQFLEWFASASALFAVLLTLHPDARQPHPLRGDHYLGQCDAALRDPQFSNPELGKLDLRSRTFDGDDKQFERYEWYVAR